MHRVELKVECSKTSLLTFEGVPNAPCGVERPQRSDRLPLASEFLMHRVELKDEDNLQIL